MTARRLNAAGVVISGGAAVTGVLPRQGIAQMIEPFVAADQRSFYSVAEFRDNLENDHVERAAPNQVVGYLERLLGGVGLRDKQVVCL